MDFSWQKTTPFANNVLVAQYSDTIKFGTRVAQSEDSTINMKLSVPEITTTPAPESSRLKNSRRASFSGVQEIQTPRVRFAGTIQVPSLPVVTRRSSVFSAQIQAPILNQTRSPSDTMLEEQKRQQQLQPILLRRGSIAPRSRSNSVFPRGLGLPAVGLFRGRRRSRILSAREIKIFQVSYSATLFPLKIRAISVKIIYQKSTQRTVTFCILFEISHCNSFL